MTDEELAAIRARVDAASLGPWRVFQKWRLEVEDANGEQVADIGYIGYDDGPDDETRRFMEADSAFIAASRQDIPALLAEVERLRAENAALRKVIDDVQEFVVLHFFDMRCGREVDALINERMTEFDTSE